MKKSFGRQSLDALRNEAKDGELLGVLNSDGNAASPGRYFTHTHPLTISKYMRI
jgi:hypothetical protein